MSGGDEGNQQQRVFQTDEEMLDFALKEFKGERAIFVQEILDVEGGLSFGKRRYFGRHAEMTHWIWSQPGCPKCVAVAINDREQKLTYNGKEIVVAYENIQGNPAIIFFESLLKMPEIKIDEASLQDSVSEIIKQLKVA